MEQKQKKMCFVSERNKWTYNFKKDGTFIAT